MKNNKLIKQLAAFGCALTLLLLSCKSNKSSGEEAAPVTPKEYFDKVIELEESMSEPLLKTEAELTARGDKEDYAGIVSSAKSMEDTVDIRINAVKKMKAVGKGGEDFKLVVVRYFEYIKSIYTGYKNIGEAKSEKTKKEAAEKMTQILNGQQGVMVNLSDAQKKYTTDNGFSIDAE